MLWKMSWVKVGRLASTMERSQVELRGGRLVAELHEDLRTGQHG